MFGDSMSIVFYLVRNKKDRSKFYQSRTKGVKSSGWVDNIYRASIYPTMHGPSQVKKIVGEEFFETIMLNCNIREGTYKTVYIIRNKITGDYICNKSFRRRKELLTPNFNRAGTWTCRMHAKSLIRAYASKNPTGILLNPDELEVIPLPVFIPNLEKL